MSFYLTDFQFLRPRYVYSQETILTWLAAAHTRAAALQQAESIPPFDAKLFEHQLQISLRRLGSGQGKVKSRGAQLADFGHTNWESMELFRLDALSTACIGKKTALYGQAVDQFFEDFYSEEKQLPKNLLHVTCTGYLSPSGAQKLVANRDAGRTTTVTHVYHMGCYAAIPAIRIARGYVGLDKQKTDIVHTELCSLHVDPYSHTAEQLVIQSLFGDGCIRYSLSATPTSPSLALLALHETTLSDTAHAMTWQPASWGMQMSLKKEVPLLIVSSIEQALDDLANEANLSRSELQAKTIFAIHPGGPKIIETVAKLLGLKYEQYAHSYAVLEKYGNMSSATLPHIWESLLHDSTVPDGTRIISLAFGPGLTVASSLMEKKDCVA